MNSNVKIRLPYGEISCFNFSSKLLTIEGGNLDVGNRNYKGKVVVIDDFEACFSKEPHDRM